jgi:hypothetical protein
MFLLLQGEQSFPQFIEELTDLAGDNPLIAVGALVLVLFLTSFLPSRRTTRTRTYGGRQISYHPGRALGGISRRGSRRG